MAEMSAGRVQVHNEKPNLIVSLRLPNTRLMYQLGSGVESPELCSSCVSRWRKLKGYERKEGVIVVSFARTSLGIEESTRDWSGTDPEMFDATLRGVIRKAMQTYQTRQILASAVSSTNVGENIAT